MVFIDSTMLGEMTMLRGKLTMSRGTNPDTTMGGQVMGESTMKEFLPVQLCHHTHEHYAWVCC
jgi:hypothetical protein